MQIVLWNGTDEINISKLRKQGCLIFLCSEEPYFYAYKKYFHYVNGFITNKGHYAHMGCCEVLVDLPRKKITFNDHEIYYGINAVYCSKDNPKYASLIQNGRYYRLTDPFKSEICAWEIVGNSQEEVLLNVVMEEIHGNMTVNYVQLRGLDESALYKEQATGKIYSGAALMHGGMPLPAEFGEYRAYQYHFVRE